MPLLRIASSEESIIETSLAKRHNLRRAGQSNKLVRRHIELFVSVVRMRSDRAIDVVKALGDREQFGLAFNARRDRHDALDSHRAGTPDNAVEIVSEVGKIEMTVAVDQHAEAFLEAQAPHLGLFQLLFVGRRHARQGRRWGLADDCHGQRYGPRRDRRTAPAPD